MFYRLDIYKKQKSNVCTRETVIFEAKEDGKIKQILKLYSF